MPQPARLSTAFGCETWIVSDVTPLKCHRRGTGVRVHHKFRQALRKTDWMRSSKGVILLASALAVVGLLLVFPFSGGTESFTFAVASPDGTLPALLFMTTQRTLGAVLVWIASLLVAGVIGHRITAGRVSRFG